MKILLAALVTASLAANGWAKLRTEKLEYKHGSVVCEGYLAYDDASKEKRPGVIIVHEWTGLGPYVMKRAEQVAELGYVALAVDIYGKGVRAKTPEEAGKLAGKYKGDRKLLRDRAAAGLDALTKNALVDSKNVAAMGYCFGGTTALEMARSGADLKGVVSFHGSLGTPNLEDAKNIKGKVLALHGADDPFVPREELLGFIDEMKKAGADWQVSMYSKAVHGFTMADAGNDPSKGMAYNEEADRRSWGEMQMFFKEIFGK